MSKRVKCVTLGDSTVGKTSLLDYYFCKNYLASNESTIGAVFRTISKLKDDEIININFWDTAGQERYRSLIPMYIRQSSIILLIYDRTNVDSFNGLERWMSYIHQGCSDDFEIILISNKKDLQDKELVSDKAGCNLARKYNIPFYSISAKTGENIEDLMNYVMTKATSFKKKIINKKESKVKLNNYETSYYNRCCSLS